MSATGSAPPTARSDSDESTPIKVALLALKGGPLFMLLFMVIFLWFATDHHLFWSFGNIGNVLEQSAGVCVIALGQLLVILTRGIDLSIGSNVSLACVVCTVVFKHSHSPFCRSASPC